MESCLGHCNFDFSVYLYNTQGNYLAVITRRSSVPERILFSFNHKLIIIWWLQDSQCNKLCERLNMS